MRVFLLEWINGKNLMNVRSNILIWLILYQLEFQSIAFTTTYPVTIWVPRGVRGIP